MTVSRTNTTLNADSTYCRPVPLNFDRSHLDEGVIRGYAAQFAKGFAPGAFKASLETWRACGTLPHMTWNGDPGDVVGKWTSILEDATGLLVTGKVALSSPRGKLVQQELRNGIDGLSAFVQVKAETGNKYTEVHLTDVSLMREAAIPAPKDAKPLKFENSIEFERWLRDQGVAKNTAKKLASGGWQKLAAGEEETSQNASLEALSKALGFANSELSFKRR